MRAVATTYSSEQTRQTRREKNKLEYQTNSYKFTIVPYYKGVFDGTGCIDGPVVQIHLISIIISVFYCVLTSATTYEVFSR